MIRIVKINEVLNQRILALVLQSKTEVGGTMQLNPEKTEFALKEMVNGMNRKIAIDAGIVQFHTHSAQCGQNCSRSIPSSTDVLTFVEASRSNKCLIHCVYTLHGCICMSIKQENVLRFSDFKKWKKNAKCRISNYIESLEHSREADMDSLRGWMEIVEDLGLSVHRFKLDETPKFELVFF